MLMLLGILSFALPGLSGFVSTYWFERDSDLIWRVATGIVLGIAIFTLLTFVIACGIGLNAISLTIALILSSLPLVSLRSREISKLVKGDLIAASTQISKIGADGIFSASFLAPFVFLTASVLLIVFFSRALYFLPDGLYTGDVSNYGDLPFHLGMIFGFAKGNNFPPQHPEIAGARLSYHFLYDLYTAILVKCGFMIDKAMLLQNSVFSICLVVILSRFAFVLTRNRNVAILTPAIVLMCGGLGFEILAQNARETGSGIFELIWQPIQNYTISVPQQPNLQWGNVLTTQLLTQRQFLIGLPLILIALTLIHQAMEAIQPDEVRLRFAKLFAAGIVIGVMPFAHIFCYFAAMAMGLLCVGFSLKTRGLARELVLMLTVALLVSIVQVVWLFHAPNPPDIGSPHFRPEVHLGWMAGSENIVLFWLRNCGPFIPLLICAVALPDIRTALPKTSIIFASGFAIFFIAANLFQLSPWIWDNSKFFVIWFVGSAPFVALTLVMSSQLGSKPWGPITATLLGSVLMLSGAIDVIRVMRCLDQQRVFSNNDIAMSNAVAHLLPHGQPILSAPTCFTGALLSGHSLVEGYPGHLWTQGYGYQKRYIAIMHIYAGSPNANKLLKLYGVHYAIVGPTERAIVTVNPSFFAQYRVAARCGDQVLYDMDEKVSR